MKYFWFGIEDRRLFVEFLDLSRIQILASFFNTQLLTFQHQFIYFSSFHFDRNPRTMREAISFHLCFSSYKIDDLNKLQQSYSGRWNFIQYLKFFFVLRYRVVRPNLACVSCVRHILLHNIHELRCAFRCQRRTETDSEHAYGLHQFLTGARAYSGAVWSVFVSYIGRSKLSWRHLWTSEIQTTQ